jgi:flagellin
MANIGTTTAFYKVETSLSRANTEVSKSMERLATGRQNANAGDRSSYVAMADTFRLDFVGTKAGIKGGSVVMGYLETGMRVLDAASGLLSRLQELAVLGANRTNTNADHEAINSEAEALADEFHRLMSTSKYKGKSMFVSAAGSEYVSMGGRDAEMTFGIATVDYSELYDSTSNSGAGRDIANSGNPNHGGRFNLQHLPSEAVLSPAQTLGVGGADELNFGKTYEITAMGSFDKTASDEGDRLITDSDLSAQADIKVGAVFTITATNGSQQYGADITVREIDTSLLTTDIEAVQAKINTARVQAGSQYAAIESAVGYTTDLTAQYELGFNAVSDVNFSMETAHLAKNQILQQAATAMLAQANQGQQGLLQLIQG